MLHQRAGAKRRGEMISVNSAQDRTILFDLLPLKTPGFRGFDIRLQILAVPGQAMYAATRRLVLKGADGIVFVADSQRPMRDANIESFNSLIENLKEFGLELNDVPIVLQFNKRDLKNVLTIDEMAADLDPNELYPHFESSAVNGDGVSADGRYPRYKRRVCAAQ